MEIIEDTNQEKKFNYFGKGSEFAVIFFKNIILTFLTFGIYYPWAKVEQLKYFYQVTELNGNRFSFTGTGKEVFKGFIKLYLIFAILLTTILIGSATHNKTLMFISLGLFYGVLILLIPFAIHGSIKYRSSKSFWNGIRFKYTGMRMEMFRLCLKGFLLTIVTLGIYGSWFDVSIRKYALNHLRFGNLTFDFKGKGDTLFWISLKFVLLFYLTLGIYSFWYIKNVYKFYIENITIYQNNKEIKLKLNITPGGIFSLVIVNMLLIIFTLGLATPWVTVRIFRYALENLVFEGELDLENISLISGDDYDDATGDDYLDFLDIDLV
jgi:uncharacterized membrane protein YjgN (DUF898 family)